MKKKLLLTRGKQISIISLIRLDSRRVLNEY